MKEIDKEVVNLCDALNFIHGIKTYESCCGHGFNQMLIFMHVTHIKALFPITRALDRNYGNVCWDLLAGCSDSKIEGQPGSCGVKFLLKSRSLGSEAYKEADKIAEKIYDFFTWADEHGHDFGVKCRSAIEHQNIINKYKNIVP